LGECPNHAKKSIDLGRGDNWEKDMMDWNGRALVQTQWLADHLGDPRLRVIDASVIMTRQDDGSWAPSSGRNDYQSSHIPGAQFVDLLTELQDRDADLPFMLPGPKAFATEIGAKGIGDEDMVVVYATAVPWWATRFWWMLKANGHNKVAVLDGGMKKWRDEGRPITEDIPEFAAAAFVAKQRPEMIADKAKVQAILDGGRGAVINALSPQLHSGMSDLGYGRPGRIAGSLNLSALTLIDHDTGAYLPDDRLRQAVTRDLGDFKGEAVCYCGGGIAATMDALVLDLLGYSEVSVYDASLSEWAADDQLPMETG